MSKGKNKLVSEPNKKIQFTKQMVEELYRCQKSVKYFSDNYCWVIHPTEGKIKLDMRDYQHRIIDSFSNHRQTVILASRQCGKTTAASMFILHYAMFTPYKCCAILANKDDTAMSILDDIKVAYENLPEWMKMGVVEYNAHTISFENGSKIFSAATSKDAIAGESVSLLYIDECALIPENLAQDFYKANYPTVAKGEKVIITSTPRGVGNLFHKIWKDASDGRNTFNPVRVDYWEVPEYSTPEWKANMIADIGQIAFNAEFGNQFIGSSSTLIAAEALKKMKPVDPIYEEPVFGGKEKMFNEFDSNFSYVASADIGMGSGNDYSTLNIFKVKHRPPTQEDYLEFEKKQEDPPEVIIEALSQDFVFRSNLIAIPDFVDYTFQTLPKWGEPFLIFENNGIGQSFLDQMMKEYYYENCYIHQDSPYFGINSSGVTKLEMVSQLKKFSEGGKLLLHDSDTINELLTFVEKKTTAGNSRYKAEEGSNDDLAVGVGWICFMCSTMWFVDALTFVI